MLMTIAIGLLIAAAVLFAIRLLFRTAVFAGKLLVMLAVILLIGGVVVGLIDTLTS